MMLELGMHDVPLTELYESPVNPRSITDDAFARLRRAIETQPEMMKARPLIALPTGEVIAGNMRLRVLKLIEEEVSSLSVEPQRGTAPTFVADLDENERREWMLRDNNEYGQWESDALAELMAAHQAAGGDMDLLGFAQPEVDELLTRAGGGGSDQGGAGRLAGPTLQERFGAPPFTVLDARSGWWRTRKREWLSMGLKSELGREGVRGSISSGDPSAGDPNFYETKREKEVELGRELSTEEYRTQHYVDPRGGENTSLAKDSTSVFDPVLAELAYRWFSGPEQSVIDPFAGGSVRGIVAAKLGREYVGVDLRPEQVEANQEQADELLVQDRADELFPAWVAGDARKLPELGVGAEEFDLVFTCPPYFNLERYSDDPADLSRATSWEAFLIGYFECLQAAVAALKNDRFAVIVVGDIREKSGRVLPLVSETIQAMTTLGTTFYNEAIYVTMIGSLRIRAARYFLESRKLGRTHQNVLVFVKGDGKRAAEAAGDVDAESVTELVAEMAQNEDDDA